MPPPIDEDAPTVETVNDLVLRYLRQQRDALHEGESALRIGESAVHRTRVAIRRFRSTLRTFGAIFADDLTGQIAQELRWYAEVLGHVRDREVQRARLAGAIRELAPDQVRGSVAEDVEALLLAEQSVFEAEVLVALDGPRYHALLNQLDEWLENPPTTKRAAQPAANVAKYVVRAERAVIAKLAKALESDDDEDLHSARKAGKRARYAAELAQEQIGLSAKQQLKRLTAVQDELGEFQDSIVAADLLLRLGDIARKTPGRDGFTYGVLYAIERERAVQARRAAARLMADLVKADG